MNIEESYGEYVAFATEYGFKVMSFEDFKEAQDALHGIFNADVSPTSQETAD